uniref:F1F0-ATP synthase delta subunit C-terminal domain-containing protein n=1 Tax=Chelydra serpentina TaxID=8475 RepID=A0A8C3XP09_CHESE
MPHRAIALQLLRSLLLHTQPQPAHPSLWSLKHAERASPAPLQCSCCNCCAPPENGESDLQHLKAVVTVFAEDGTATKYFVSSGSITVNAVSSVQLLAEEVATLDMLDLAAAKSNLDKALSQLAAAPDETAKVGAQINVEASEALVKALE